MISSAKVKKVFAYMLPHLGKLSKAELDRIYSDLERILGYDPAKAAKYRKDAKERDAVTETLMNISLARAEEEAGADRMRMPARLTGFPQNVNL